MNNRELLELAAKAAGIRLFVYGADGHEGFQDQGAQKPWNPLTDDGDAFRLMNDLEMRYGYNAMNCEYEAVANNLTHKFGASDKDPRRVIVLVAAAIGEAIP